MNKIPYIADKIAKNQAVINKLERENLKLRFQPVVNSEGDIISYADYEEMIQD